MRRFAWQFGLMLLVFAADLRAQGPGEGSPPAFAVRLSDGSFRKYQHYDDAPAGGTISDEFVDAAVSRGGPEANLWTLSLTPKRLDVVYVCFPWMPEMLTMGASIEDDIVFYPRLTGVTFRAKNLKEWDWEGYVYPGPSFAPMVILADERDGFFVAATNFPPRAVTPQFSRGRIMLRYDERVGVGETRRYSAMISRVRHRPERNVDPWHVACDEYRQWLYPRAVAAGILPVEYPDWLWEAHGWLQVLLQKLSDKAVESHLITLWRNYGRQFPWIQMWGQMSDRHPTPGQETGCCVDRNAIHSRYLPGLPHAIETLRRGGSELGMYVRMRDPYEPIAGDFPRAEENLRFVTDWVEDLQRLGMTRFYLDTLGAKHVGPALEVAELLRDRFPPGSVIEYPVDLYPAAFLISGGLRGKYGHGGPEDQYRIDHPDFDKGTFPRLGRYLLGDRIMFLGGSNGDYKFWGNARRYHYWTERQAFLLGCKLDVRAPWERADDPTRMNRAVREILGAWTASEWWSRRPVYRDRVGLEPLPRGIDARRFSGRSGETLVAIDNWERRPGQEIVLDGLRIPVPEEELSVIVIPAN